MRVVTRGVKNGDTQLTVLGGGGRRKRTPSLGVIGMYVVNGHAHRVNVGVQDWSEEAELGRRVRVLHGELHLCLKGGGGGGGRDGVGCCT